jgi:hypothetical protein
MVNGTRERTLVEAWGEVVDAMRWLVSRVHPELLASIARQPDCPAILRRVIGDEAVFQPQLRSQ